MNILFLIDGLSGGGAERVIITLATAMTEKGHDVTIVSLRSGNAYPLPEGVHYYLVEDSYRGPFHRQTEIGRRARALDRALASLFSTKQIDLAISHLPKTDRIVAASKYLRNPWFCLHCALVAGELDNKKGWKRWRKHRQLIKTYSQKRLITVSEALEQDVRTIGIRPAFLRTIYNPFDLEKIRGAAQEKSAFEKEKFLLHVGRFHPQKRHDRLLEAFKLSGYPGKLVLLGEGDSQEKKKIEDIIEKQGLAGRVLFAGFVTNPYPVMRAAQALVLSSDYEGFGNVLVEALACSTQVVSTNAPYGPAEILRGPLAQGLSQLTAESLAAAMRRVIASPITITEEMLAPFTVHKSVENYLSLGL
ncbi:MAG: glycosyltransferase [Chthoniobacterales bacterium]|nr:glycosyltransferase [Chthoniobacterales bacterium]